MTDAVPRLRMFAGPNGSGKTTVKENLNKSRQWFGIYINPDDLEKEIRDTGELSLDPFGLTFSTEEIQSYFADSEFLQSQHLHQSAGRIRSANNRIDFGGIAFNSYHASVLSDLLRRKALSEGLSFSFETVMSSPDKVQLLAEAQQSGYRTYLYYIATEDPEINIARVQNRVAEGGHDVPHQKVRDRYHRSIRLLVEALSHTNRAFLFDTSAAEPLYFAEVADGKHIDLKSEELPNWFRPTWEALFAGDRD